MKNLTQEEQDYILKVLNFDLKIAKEELDGNKYSKMNIEKLEYQIEFLTNLCKQIIKQTGGWSDIPNDHLF